MGINGSSKYVFNNFLLDSSLYHIYVSLDPQSSGSKIRLDRQEISEGNIFEEKRRRKLEVWGGLLSLGHKLKPCERKRKEGHRLSVSGRLSGRQSFPRYWPVSVSGRYSRNSGSRSKIPFPALPWGEFQIAAGRLWTIKFFTVKDLGDLDARSVKHLPPLLTMYCRFLVYACIFLIHMYSMYFPYTYLFCGSKIGCCVNILCKNPNLMHL